jgi:hypothetical protein
MVADVTAFHEALDVGGKLGGRRAGAKQERKEKADSFHIQ